MGLVKNLFYQLNKLERKMKVQGGDYKNILDINASKKLIN